MEETLVSMRVGQGQGTARGFQEMSPNGDVGLSHGGRGQTP